MAQAIIVRSATGGPELTGSAEAINVLSGETFYKDNGNEKLQGTLPFYAVLSTYGGTMELYNWSVTPITNS